MEVREVTYRRTFNLGNYESAQVELRAAIASDEDPKAAMDAQAAEAKAWRKSKETAYQAIRHVKENANIDQRYEKTTPADGKFGFRLRAANHQIVAESIAYDKAEDRDDAMVSMRRAGEAVVVGGAI